MCSPSVLRCLRNVRGVLTMLVPCSLIAKWKKPGYEKLCCIRCIQTRVSIWAC